MSRWNKPRDIELPPELAQAQQDINECFDRLFLALRRSPIGNGEGVLPVDNGGTGLGFVPIGDLLVGQGSSILGLLPDVDLGYALISGGIGAAPSYGKINLTLHVIGVLPIANGGTGQSTKTEAFDALSPTTTKGDMIAHNGSDNVRVPVGTDGQFLKADSGAAAGVSWDEPTAEHEILQEDTHTDAETATRVLGDLIAALAPSETATAWLDGLPSDLLPSDLDTTGEDYWIDGEPYDGIGLGESGADVKWRRLPIGSPGQVLKSNGTNPEWGDAGDVGEIVASAQPKVRVYASGNTAIATGAGTDDSNGGTKIDFDGESFDTDSFHSTLSNTSRLTVPAGKGGTYLIVGTTSWETSTGGRKCCWIYKNGTTRVGLDELPDAGDSGLSISHAAVCFAVLAEGDYVELHVRQDSGGSLFVLGEAAGNLTSLAMYKLP